MPALFAFWGLFHVKHKNLQKCVPFQLPICYTDDTVYYNVINIQQF